MKRCPLCRKSYSDDTLNFCLDDGEQLLDDAADPTAFRVWPLTYQRYRGLAASSAS